MTKSTNRVATPPAEVPPALSPVRRAAAPLRRQVVDDLRRGIITGGLAPGARLIERDLTEMMGVSRTVIREALRQLESEGLIVTVPNKGPMVHKLSIAEANELYSIRAVLEGLAARLFVQNADALQIENLRRALTLTVEAYRKDDPEHVLETKNAFYDTLAEGAGSKTLSTMIGGLHARICRWRAVGLAHPKRSRDRSRESVDALKRLLRAIEARDADRAEGIMRDEVSKAAAEVTRLISE